MSIKGKTIIQFFAITIAFFYFIEKSVFLYAPPAKNPEINQFSGFRAFGYWNEIASVIPKRPMSSLLFNQSYQYIMEFLQQKSDRNVNNSNYFVTLEEQSGEIRYQNRSYNNQIHRDVRNLLFRITPKESNVLPLLISAHIDSQTSGPGAYDDAAAIAVMMELVNDILDGTKILKVPVLFLFVGTEEIGLQGSNLFLKLNVPFAAYLNVESLGPGLPMILLQKGNGTSETVRAWSTTPRVIVATMIDDLIKIGIVSSSSDSANFKAAGYSGAEALFIGNPTKYHTPKDSIGSPDHLQLLGDALYNFIYEYNISAKDLPASSIGVSPFVFSLPDRLRQYMSLYFSLMILVPIVFLVMRKELLSFIYLLLLYLLAFVLSLLISIGVSFLLYQYNSLSYAPNPFTSFILLSIVILVPILFVFSFIPEYVLNKRNAHALSVVFLSVLCLLSRNLDSSILFIWMLPLSLLSFIFMEFALLSKLISLFSLLPLSLIWFCLYRAFVQYSMLIPDFKGEVVPFIMCVLYLFFYLMVLLPHFLTLKNTRISMFLLVSMFISSIAYLILKNPSLSNDFNVQGAISHFFFDEGESVVTYIPRPGKRILKIIYDKINDLSNIKMDNNHTFPHKNTPLLFKDSNMDFPPFISKWPEFSFSSIDINGTLETFKFSVPEFNQYMHKVTLIIKCPGYDCLHEIEGFPKVSFFGKKENHVFFIRVFPAYEPTEFNLTLNRTMDEKIPIDVFFGYELWTEDLFSFVKDLPSYVLPLDFSSGLCDTNLVNQTLI